MEPKPVGTTVNYNFNSWAFRRLKSVSAKPARLWQNLSCISGPHPTPYALKCLLSRLSREDQKGSRLLHSAQGKAGCRTPGPLPLLLQLLPVHSTFPGKMNALIFIWTTTNNLILDRKYNCCLGLRVHPSAVLKAESHIDEGKVEAEPLWGWRGQRVKVIQKGLRDKSKAKMTVLLKSETSGQCRHSLYVI